MPPADALGDRCRRNVEAVREQVAAACRSAGRSPDEVTVIAVTKYAGPEIARLLHAAGCRDLAESRPQSLWAKADALADVQPQPRWHLVGHLQRNKIRRTLPLLAVLHSLDSLRLLAAVEAEAAAVGRTCRALVEVNLANDPGRTGATPADAESIVAASATMPHVEVIGLMGMASAPDGDSGAARREFAGLRELRDRLRANVPGGERLTELSMGMSGDFAEAILEGATMVRIGSAFFAGLT